MKDPNHITNTDPSLVKPENGSADLRNQTTRRTFLQTAGLGAAALAAHRVTYGAEKVLDKDGKVIQGFENVEKANSKTSKGWKPVSDRKIRVGIVGYGFCKFGAAFGFQDHPNVEVVAVSDFFSCPGDGLGEGRPR